MKYLLPLAFTVVLFTGCTVNGHIEDKSQVIECTDVRDKSVFVYKSDTVTDIRLGFNTVSMNIVTIDGVAMHITEKDEPFYKCVPYNG